MSPRPDSAEGFGRQPLTSGSSSKSPMARNPALLDVPFLKRIEDLPYLFVTLQFATTTFRLRNTLFYTIPSVVLERVSEWIEWMATVQRSGGPVEAGRLRGPLDRSLAATRLCLRKLSEGGRCEMEGNYLIRRDQAPQGRLSRQISAVAWTS
jgi:hypothetical protein